MYLSGIAQQQGAARAMRDRRMSGGRLRQRGDNRPMLAACRVTRCGANQKQLARVQGCTVSRLFSSKIWEIGEVRSGQVRDNA